MQMETVVLLTDWLAGISAPGKGLNDFIPLVPRLPIDAAAPPNIVHFADPFRDANCAAWYTGAGEGGPKKLNAVYVAPDGPADGDGEAGPVFRRCPSLAVVARICIRQPDLAKAARYAEYYRRAGVMSVQAMMADDAEARAGRTLGSIHVESANRVIDGPWAEDVGESRALGVIAVDVAVRDNKPRG
jgi:hypothetical protein